MQEPAGKPLKIGHSHKNEMLVSFKKDEAWNMITSSPVAQHNRVD